jgi:hypothetical protein
MSRCEFSHDPSTEGTLMANGLLVVESRPASDDATAYHRWYDETHIPEILKLHGFTAARRLRAADGDTFITVYEIDGDVDAARAALTEAQSSGAMSPPNGVQLSPPPVVRWFHDV